MKKLITAICILVGCVANAQYNPSNFTVSNKSYGVAQAVSTDARSWFYDATNFVMRDYQSTSEVNTYLNLAKYRSGHFPIFIHSGGSLSGGGVWVGGTTLVYWYKDSTGNANLVRWYTDSVVVSGFLLASNNLSDLANIPTAKVNLGINLVNNTSDATKNAAAVSLTNHTIDGSLNTLLNIGNSSLTNSTIGLSVDATGTDITITGTPASLGGTLGLHIPTASVSNRGFLSSADWITFRAKVDSTSLSGGDSIFDWHNGSKVFRYISGGITGAANGLSTVAGVANLGQTVGAGGSPGALTSTREIPMAGFNIDLSGSTGNFIIGSNIDSAQRLQVNGNVAIFGQSNVVQQLIKLPGSQTVGVPFYMVKSSTADTVFAMSANSKWNLFIGVGAGANCVQPVTSPFAPGGSNIGIGGAAARGAALALNTTGFSNVAIGGSALASNTSGGANTAVGLDAMIVSTTGGFNSAFGQASLAFNTTGSLNTGLGQDAERQNTTGTQNTAIGALALVGNQTGSLNTAVGAGALGQTNENVLANSVQNTALGYSAGFNTAMGSNNTFVGYNAISSVTIGASNTYIGSNVTPMLSTVSNTVVIADGDGDKRVTSDTSNVSLGRSNMPVLTTGTHNVAMGNRALAAITSGSDNIGIGNNALSVTSTATNNIGIGSAALQLNNTANANLAIGVSTMQANTSGSLNVALGNSTLILANGSNNVAIGFSVAPVLTNATENTILGSQAAPLITTGSTNTIIGKASGGTLTTGSNNTFIGANIIASSPSLSNSIILADGVGTQRLNINSSGSIKTTVQTASGDTTTFKPLLQDASGNLARGSFWLPNVFDGKYTPATSSLVNLGSATSSLLQYMRVGNTVTVSGLITISVTSSAITTSFDIALPVGSASNFSSVSNAGGGGSNVDGNAVRAIANTGTHLITLSLIPTNTGTQSITFSCTYTII